MDGSSVAKAGSEKPGGGKTSREKWQKAISGVREEIKSKRLENDSENMTAAQKWVQLTNSITKRMKTGVSDFFGVEEERNGTESALRKKWENRSNHLIMTNRLFGGTRRNLVQRDNRTDGVQRNGGRETQTMEIQLDQPDQHLLADELDSSSKRMKRKEPDAYTTRPTVWGLTVNGMKQFMLAKPVSKVAPCRRSFAPYYVKNATVSRPSSYDDFFESPSRAIKPSFYKMAADEGSDLDVPDVGVKSGYRRVGEKTTKNLTRTFITRKHTDEEADRALYEDDTDGISLAGLKRIPSAVFEFVSDNTNRDKMGIGLVGKWLDFDVDDRNQDPEVRKQLNALAADDHRPYFTFWVTFVQIVIYIFAVAVYGIAPIGISETRIEAEVLIQMLAIERVHYSEPDNLWIGPRQADLIHLGARYSPCMRQDSNIEQAIAEDRFKESHSACCVRNDGSGCVQSQERLCSQTLSMWLKWGVKNVTGPGGRTSGSVCGQDPKYCKNPFSLPPFEWPDDISKWPICQESSPASKGDDDKHMKCDVIGRPCCVGIHGQCIITTREFCEFRRGYFHEEATLCSQISCMNEICGMIPFLNPEKPNQFYRLWTSLFLHAGLFQLLISIVFQLLIMRSLEIHAGWLRICIIYIVSGIAGSLASAIFIPYHVEAGPSGSQFGILSCFFVQVIQNWHFFERPCWNLGKLTLIVAGLFVIGLLPMVDNWAHLFGFIIGFLLAFALLPYVTFGVMDGRRKLIGIIICLATTVGMFSMLVLLFYVFPVYKCHHCEYFNCIPFTPTFCKSMEVKITRTDEF